MQIKMKNMRQMDNSKRNEHFWNETILRRTNVERT